ncbi:MAG: DUF4236 domain-containing protein [Acidobacteriota bacterium]
MGLRIRKSVKVGPFRFNLSGSGIGVSTGLKGLRVGAGPRGTYVSVGRHVTYYQNTASSPSAEPRRHVSTGGRSAAEVLPEGTHDPLVEIESSDVTTMVDSSSGELLNEIQMRRKQTSLTVLAGLAALVVFPITLLSPLPTWAKLLVALALVASITAARVRDISKKSVVLFYDFQDDMATRYSNFLDSAEALSSCNAIWHIQAQGRVRDKKYHAGADSLIRRNHTFLRKAQPKWVELNIDVMALGVGLQTLFFLPDRILVYQGAAIGAIHYSDLALDVHSCRFIEDGRVPRDAEVVGQTWRYVNKSGGPDRRFTDNPQIPICHYEEISFSSSSGLNELIQVSRVGHGQSLAAALAALTTAPQPGVLPPHESWMG